MLNATVTHHPDEPIISKGGDPPIKTLTTPINLLGALLGGLTGTFLGGWDGFLLCLTTFVVIDYLTGFVAAASQRRLSSAAGFAGIVNAPVVSLAPDVGEAILVQTFVVVVIGGVGSFPGAVLGGLIAGELISLTSMVNPAYSYVVLFVVMTLVLMFRPRGLLGAVGRE